MATKATPIQILRSEVLKKRPDPARLLSGQPAVNINAAEPGLFFADDTGATLFKVGPCSVGVTAPNAGATGPVGALGNTLGDLWMDTDSTANPGGPVLKVWDGTQWLPCIPNNSTTIVSATAPNILVYNDGAMWWDSSTGLLYILYADGTSRQWTQVSSNTVG